MLKSAMNTCEGHGTEQLINQQMIKWLQSLMQQQMHQLEKMYSDKIPGRRTEEQVD